MLEGEAPTMHESLNGLERFLKWVAFVAVLVVAAGLGVGVAWVFNVI